MCCEQGKVQSQRINLGCSGYKKKIHKNDSHGCVEELEKPPTLKSDDYPFLLIRKVIRFVTQTRGSIQTVIVVIKSTIFVGA